MELFFLAARKGIGGLLNLYFKLADSSRLMRCKQMSNHEEIFFKKNLKTPQPATIGGLQCQWVLLKGGGEEGRVNVGVCVYFSKLSTVPFFKFDVLFFCSALDTQKMTWRSNKHDINICHMKGKHEVSTIVSI